jgi:hypothetical protein
LNAIKKLNAAIVLALTCFVFASTPLNAVTVAEVERAIANAEAAGDFAAANRMRQAIRDARASTDSSYEAARAKAEAELEAARAAVAALPKDTGFFDEAAYFLGFGEKAKREKLGKRITACNALAADYYLEKLEDAQNDPSLWQLGGYESARDYANVDGFRRSCINR